MTVTILQGDCRDVLRLLPADSVQCIVTSPPYYGLRDYDVDGQIGLEQTPDAYVAEMVAVFREVRRVLRDDGTLWLNLGDSYAGSRCGPQGAFGEMADRSIASQRMLRSEGNAAGRSGARPKNLLMIPARVAIALQADGWWLRSDIIWEKPAPMPESADDRPTSSHEHVFLLTKRPDYFYDAEAIKEPTTGNAHARGSGVHPKASDHLGIKQNTSFSAAVTETVQARNRRNVWRIESSPFPGAHFATMPVKLARECIKAGTSEAGCCAACGAQLARVVENGAPDMNARARCGADRHGGYRGESTKGHAAAGVQDASAVKARILAGMVRRSTLGWKPTCRCETTAPPVPCTVLDPFGGAGTTGLAATQLGRDATLIELSAKYCEMARARCAGERYVDADRQRPLNDDTPLFANL